MIFPLFQDSSFIAAITSTQFPNRLLQFLQDHLWQPTFYVFPRKQAVVLGLPLLLPGNQTFEVMIQLQTQCRTQTGQ